MYLGCKVIKPVWGIAIVRIKIPGGGTLSEWEEVCPEEVTNFWLFSDSGPFPGTRNKL